MKFEASNTPTLSLRLRRPLWLLSVVAATIAASACAQSTTATQGAGSAGPTVMAPGGPDPRVGLRAGLNDAAEAIWNLRVLSRTTPGSDFVGETNSDLAFTGNYAIQGNYNGFQIWDISNPSRPTLAKGYVCPASQSDVSVYRNLLFVSGEDYGARLDCGTQGVREAVSPDRLRGIRIFDISDIRNPRSVGSVQTCRGSHTHSLLVDPNDTQNVYVYVSGSSPVRSATELAGCSDAPPSQDPNSGLFRIEVIRVPLAAPERAAIVSSPRIFTGLVAPPKHGVSPEDMGEVNAARARGAFVVDIDGEPYILRDVEANSLLTQVVAARGGSGAPTAADSAELRRALPEIVAQMTAGQESTGPTQCHDITLYPALGLAGGACEGYGLLIDIRDPVNPQRLTAVADSNFSYWHSATFNNDGTKILFSDEWGGGGGPKCRAADPKEWGADAMFSIENRQLIFRGYYKLPAVQTAQENCVAHNGSMIPIPGRDVMIQSWYQGGLSLFDWTDATHPQEIGFFDRGPVNAERMAMGGSWSVYWYNGAIVSSEIARGLDILELAPSQFISQNEIDAAKTVRFDYFNAQGQQRFVWPPSFSLALAYVDQLERSSGLAADRIAAVRRDLAAAQGAAVAARRTALTALGTRLTADAGGARDGAKVRMLADAVNQLAAAQR